MIDDVGHILPHMIARHWRNNVWRTIMCENTPDILIGVFYTNCNWLRKYPISGWLVPHGKDPQ